MDKGYLKGSSDSASESAKLKVMYFVAFPEPSGPLFDVEETL